MSEQTPETIVYVPESEEPTPETKHFHVNKKIVVAAVAATGVALTALYLKARKAASQEEDLWTEAETIDPESTDTVPTES